MGREIRPDFQQQLLFPPAIEDWIPADHPARFIRTFVESLDLRKLGFREPPGPRGGVFFSLESLLCIWLFGYFERIRSSRALERACMNHVGFIWLTGNRAPDHNTIWRFWKKNRKALKGLFRSAVRVAVASDLVGMALHAVDGTKIAAASSKRGLKRKKQLQRLLASLDENVESAAKEIDANGRGDSPDYRLPESLEKQEALREKIKNALDRVENETRSRINPDEPDARLMKGNGNIDLSYNAQAVTDEQSGVVVAAEIADNAHDHGQLVTMLDEVKETLGAVAEETAADGGYSSGTEMSKAEERGYSVLIRPQEGRPHSGAKSEFASKNFRFEPETNQVICPKGEILIREGRPRWGRRRKYKVQSFRCKRRECPFRASCTRDPRGRQIQISEHRSAEMRMRKKLEVDEKRKALKRRSQIAERTFAVIKHIGGFRRWLYRGLASVRAQWYLVCTALNLRILYRSWRQNRNLLTLA